MALSSPVLKPVTSVGPTSFILSWSATTGAIDYLLYVAKTSTESVDAVTGLETYILSNFHPGYNGKIISGTRWEVTNLLPSTTYYIQLVARRGVEQSPKLAPLVVNTLSQPNRLTNRGLRVDLAFEEFRLQGAGIQSFCLDNLLKGADNQDGSYPQSYPTSDDVYPLAHFSDPYGTGLPKASTYLTLAILRFIKGFKGKVTSVLNRLRSEFASFTERSFNSIDKAQPNFPSPYVLLGPAFAEEFFIKDKTGAEPVPAKQDTFGYWTIGNYSSTQTGANNQVLKPLPIIYSQTEVPEVPNVSVDFLRVGSTFNIAVDSSGQGGLQNRPPANVSSDTGYMIVVSSISEPGRKFYVPTEKLN